MPPWLASLKSLMKNADHNILLSVFLLIRHARIANPAVCDRPILAEIIFLSSLKQTFSPIGSIKSA